MVETDDGKKLPIRDDVGIFGMFLHTYSLNTNFLCVARDLVWYIRETLHFTQLPSAMRLILHIQMENDMKTQKRKLTNTKAKLKKGMSNKPIDCIICVINKINFFGARISIPI